MPRQPASIVSARASLLARLGWLPRGRTLPAELFAARHAWLRRVLWLHVAGVPALAAVLGDGAPAGYLLLAVPVAVLALLGTVVPDVRAQSVFVSVGLLTASATVAHATDGATESQFHFFLALSALALYEDWLPYGLGVAYVVLHHAVLEPFAPVETFGHSGDVPAMVAVHTAFIVAGGAANVTLWKAHERARAGMAAASRRVELQYEVTTVLAGALTLADATPRLLAVIGERLGFSMGLLLVPGFDGRVLRPAATWTADERLAATLERHRSAIALAPGVGVAGRAWVTNAPVACDRLPTETSAEYGALATALGMAAGIAVPIGYRDDVAGVLTFLSEIPRVPDGQTIELLESLSRQLGLFMDRLRRAEDAAVYHDAAMTDALTGLPNRRSWDVALDEHVARAARAGTPLALALLDLDHFKAYNDAYGHQAGDAMLAAVAREWRAAVRADDVLARYGGEEFGLIMPDCDLAGALPIVERLLARVPGGATCSIGLAASGAPESPADLVRRADEALYGAKAAGRDRVVVAPDPTLPVAA